MKTIIISSILSMLLTTGTPVAFGSPSNTSTFAYGTITKEFINASTTGEYILELAGVSSTMTGYVSNYVIQFNRPCNGTFKVSFFDNRTNYPNYQLFVRGGTLVSWDNTGITFMVRGSDRFEMTLVDSLTSGLNHQQFTTTTTISAELIDTDSSMISDIVQYLYDVDGYQQLISSNVNTIRNILLTSMGGYVSNNGSLYTDMQTLITALNDINNYGELPYYSYQAYKLFSNIGTLQDFSYSGSMIYKSFNKSFKLKTIANSPYQASQVFEIKPGQTFHIIGFFSHNITSQTIRLIDGSGTIYNLTPNTLFNINTMKLIDFYFKNNGTSSILPMIQPANDSQAEVIPIYAGMNIPSELAYDLNLDTDNILIRSINAVEQAIRNMSVNVNNLTVNATGITYNTTNQDVNNSVTTYNTNITTVNNIENDFKTMFDNANQNYNVDNIPITNELVTTGNFMKDVTAQLYGLDIIKYPTALLLLGIVIIALLG